MPGCQSDSPVTFQYSFGSTIRPTVAGSSELPLPRSQPPASFGRQGFKGARTYRKYMDEEDDGNEDAAAAAAAADAPAATAIVFELVTTLHPPSWPPPSSLPPSSSSIKLAHASSPLRRGTATASSSTTAESVKVFDDSPLRDCCDLFGGKPLPPFPSPFSSRCPIGIVEGKYLEVVCPEVEIVGSSVSVGVGVRIVGWGEGGVRAGCVVVGEGDILD